ncbi:MAG: hypothetical protein K0R33_4364, partial [Mycobacterium sp.]|nr:hypothetical protein [Mycobacterium sp.]
MTLDVMAAAIDGEALTRTSTTEAVLFWILG